MENQTEQRPQLNFLNEYSFEKTPVLAGIVTTVELIALKPVVENLGLDWSSQLKRLKREDTNGQLWSFCKFISDDKKAYEMVCMRPFEFQNWLFDLNPSENLKIELWSSYKKGLVIYLLEMLKVSMDEVLRLRNIETNFNIFKTEVTDYINAHNEGKEYTKSAKEKFKEANSIEKRILDRMNGIQPNQLQIF